MSMISVSRDLSIIPSFYGVTSMLLMHTNAIPSHVVSVSCMFPLEFACDDMENAGFESSHETDNMTQQQQH